MYEDEWDDGWCDACDGEGEISVLMCIGRCNENGEHEKKDVCPIHKESR